MNQQTEPTPPRETDTQLLERLTQWGEALGKRLATQPRWFEQLEEHLLIELNSQLPGEAFVDGFADALLDIVLQCRIQGALGPYEPPTDELAMWYTSTADTVLAQRRTVLVQVVEAMSGRLACVYTDALQPHWSKDPEGVADVAGYRRRLQTRLDSHKAECEALFGSAELAGQTPQGLRARMEDLEHSWRTQVLLRALASDSELERLDRLAKPLEPDWMKGLSQAQWDALKATQARLEDAVHVHNLLMDGVATLREHAGKRAQQYLWQQTGHRMHPEQILIHRRFPEGYATHSDTVSLAALVAAGPVNVAGFYEIHREDAPQRYAHALSPALVEELLAAIDAPSDYLQALTTRYGSDELEEAMKEEYEARLQHSLLIGRYAGHVGDALADQVKAAAGGEAGALHVRTLGLQPGSHWCDLLLFYRESPSKEIDRLVLYAPDKPDGQEWVELNSLRAVTEEIVGWLENEAGRQYLSQLTPHALLEYATGQYAKLALKVGSWDRSLELRGLPAGYGDCSRDLVHARQNRHLGDVQRRDSPDWYRNLTTAGRRLQNTERQKASLFEKAFERQLDDYEPYLAFVRRTVAERIRPYLRSVGVTEEVDPETVLIDYHEDSAGLVKGTMTLLDMALHGYSDTSGIDDPRRGVRSSAGQNLEAVRSAPLAIYARSAYLGQQYVETMAARYLDESADTYSARRRAFNRMLVAMLDRDLRQGLGQQHLDLEDHSTLTRLVTEASQWTATPARPEGSESVARTDGIFRLTLDAKPILGVYVFRVFKDGRAKDWLYTPDSPDQRLLRPYADLRGDTAVVLHDYLVGRATQATRVSASALLVRLAAQQAHPDSLREGQRVRRLVDEFNTYVQHGLDEVSQVSTTRRQLIEAHVLKGLFLCALPLALVCAPFALLMDAAFLAAGMHAAIVAHAKGDTNKALMGWLQASWAVLGVVLVGRSAVAGLRSVAGGREVAGGKAVRLEALGMNRRWALEHPPAGLVGDGTEGVWKGTQVAADGRHYVRYRGRYYRLEHRSGEDFLRVVNSQRPDAMYKLPVQVTSDGGLRPVLPGLRGGNRMEDAGYAGSLEHVVPGLDRPELTRGALQGEYVCAQFLEGAQANYLYTLNLQSCVGVALYNPVSRMGAVLHIDHKVANYIRPLINGAVERLRASGPEGEITAVMVGGDWLLSSNIGKPVRALLSRNGLVPTWRHWSYSSFLGANTYGMTLDLQTGITRAYLTPAGFAERLYNGLHGRLQRLYGNEVGPGAELDGISRRMLRFMNRVAPGEVRRVLPRAPADSGDPKAFALVDFTRSSN
ncbi:hypothetical protein [Pseudomonas sp. LS_2]|uniref:hypothetical protein n=1 Tax=Pseudomonas sp. LS_2 TaxID=3055789 RepID=UPI003653D71D